MYTTHTSIRQTTQWLQTLRTTLRLISLTAIAITAVVCSACYHNVGQNKTHHAETVSADTVEFERTHHYTINYNFVVKADSLVLVRQQPEELLNNMLTDSVTVYRHNRLVVADIRVMPSGTADSVWIQVARDQQTFGWAREQALLAATVPSDPISQFISVFSDTHLLIFLIVISTISVAYLMRTLLRRNARIVHFNDIGSVYPTLLALNVAAAAVIYSSIQNFEPDAWRHFYFHPTLNPLNVPPVLAVFLIAVWAMPVLGLAVADSVRRLLPPAEALLYLCGLASICAANYIIFSIATLYYIGYPLLVAYACLAIKIYFKRAKCNYICGKCGAGLRHKGICPQCGAMNT